MSEKFLTKKSLGQHFLTSDIIPKKMCDAAEVKSGEVVVEIGPGTGVLTKEILKRGACVMALEADLRAIEVLKEEFKEAISERRLLIHHADVRNLDPSQLGLKHQSYKVVANIPYYLSGMLLRIFLENAIQPAALVFLMQKELVERIARDKKGSLLSQSVRIFGEPKYVTTVKRGHFSPPPKVDSAILLIENISHERLAGLGEKDFFAILQLGFGQKRKQLQHNLRTRFSQEKVFESLLKVGLRKEVRAEDLSTKEWVKLAKELL